MTLKSAEPNKMNDAEILHLVQWHSNLLNQTTMQKFCTLFNDTKTCWTKQRCRNSALLPMTLESAELKNNAEILHLVQWLNSYPQICWTQQRHRNSAPRSMCNYLCHFCEPNKIMNILNNIFVVFKVHLSLGICARQDSEFCTLPIIENSPCK